MYAEKIIIFFKWPDKCQNILKFLRSLVIFDRTYCCACLWLCPKTVKSIILYTGFHVYKLHVYVHWLMTEYSTLNNQFKNHFLVHLSSCSNSMSLSNYLSQSLRANSSSSDDESVSPLADCLGLYVFLSLWFTLLVVAQSDHQASIVLSDKRSLSSGPSTLTSSRSLNVEVLSRVCLSVLITFNVENMLSTWPLEKGKLNIRWQSRRTFFHLLESGETCSLYQTFWWGASCWQTFTFLHNQQPLQFHREWRTSSFLLSQVELWKLKRYSPLLTWFPPKCLFHPHCLTHQCQCCLTLLVIPEYQWRSEYCISTFFFYIWPLKPVSHSEV